MINIDFTKEPKEVVDFLKKKKLTLSFDYKELMHEAHHTSFTVAKITRLDLLADMHESLQSAFKEGKLFKQWRDEITPTLQAKGWLGEVTAINPTTGEVKDIFVGSRRLKNIYQTNMRTAYDQVHYRNLMESDSEYWRYVSLLEGNRRPTHRAMHGIILPRSHPFWKKNKPRCAWGCQCRVNGYTKEELDARGWKVSTGNFPDIAEEDWAYEKLDSSYKAEQTYFEKVKAFTCKESNAKTISESVGTLPKSQSEALPCTKHSKIRTVLCPFVEAVKSGYLADMLSLLPKKKEWDSFVDRALDTTIKNHEEMRLGYLSAITGLETYLKENPPKSDLILADTGSIRNLQAKASSGKQGKVLEVKEIKELLTKVHTPDAIYKEEQLLLIYDFDEGKNKIVIGVDAGDKNKIYHTIKSGQKYTTEQFESLLSDGREIKKIF